MQRNPPQGPLVLYVGRMGLQNEERFYWGPDATFGGEGCCTPISYSQGLS